MNLKRWKHYFQLLRSWLAYEQMVVRLIWRGGLSEEFASVMAVQGQMRRSEVWCLYQLAQTASPEGVIVEIGSYRGLSTIALAKGSLSGSGIPVYSIDPHDYTDPAGMVYTSEDNAAFFINVTLAGIASLVKPISLLSWDAAVAWNKPISLLWIDGSHEFEAVTKDFLHWSPFVIKNGIIAFHDSTDQTLGPYLVVQSALASGNYILKNRVDKVSVLVKR